MTYRSRSLRTWIIGSLGAVALHAGAFALAYAQFQDTDPDDADGAPVIELAVVLEAPRAEASDLPPGPEAEASAAASAAAEQTHETEETPLPEEVPTESEDADRVVSRQEVKDPVEKVREKSETQTQASTESVASEATAPPAMEDTPEAPKAVAPAQGLGRNARRVLTTWQKKLVTHLDHNKRYPTDGKRRNREVLVSFTLDRVGHVVEAHVIRGSGDDAFDEAALAMMKRADPVPAPPALIADEGLTFTVPVIFRAKS